MSKDNGGDAFPSPGVVIDYDKNEHQQGAYGGMSLRDYFAAAAASGYTSNQEWMKNGRLHRPDLDTDEAVAMASYEVADAMLAERAK